MKILSPSALFLAALFGGFAIGDLQAQVSLSGAGGRSPAWTRPVVSWSSLGPGGGGWISCITVVDDPGHTLYVGSDVGGIYRSSDGGATWELKNRGLGMYYIQDIAFDPQVKSTLYAATRGGLFKSVDGGDHWEAKRTGFPPLEEFSFSAPLSDIAVDPVHPGTLYVGVGVPRAGYEAFHGYHWSSSATKGAIFKSSDHGESWTLIQGTGIDPDAMIYSLEVDPSQPSRLYAATSAGIYRSTDSGASWSPSNTGLPQLMAMALTLDPTSPSVLYTTLWAEPGSAQWQGGVYKSTDGGTSWVAKNSGLDKSIDPEAGLTSNYPELLVDPQNPQVLYVGHTPWWPEPGVYKSVDGGDHWSWVTRSEPPNVNMDLGWIVEHGPFERSMAIDPLSGQVYLGTSTHLFTSGDGGATWQQLYTDAVGGGYWKGRGLETSVVQDVVVDPSDPSRIYVGYWDMGFLKSIDGGNSFKRTFAGMTYDSNTFSIVVDPLQPGRIWAATGWWEENKGEVVLSTDFGETWVRRATGLPVAQVWSLALDEFSSPSACTLYATSYGHGVYKTSDGGQSWSAVNQGLGVGPNRQAIEVAVSPSTPGLVFAGFEALDVEHVGGTDTYQGGLFRSADGGAHWVRVDRSLPQMTVWDIAFDPGDPLVVYSAVSGAYDHTRQVTYPGGIYKSTDGGLHWTNSSTGFGSLGKLHVVSVAVCPTQSNLVMAVTTDSPFHDRSSGRGIWVSSDAGGHWSPVNGSGKDGGLGILDFVVIAFDPSHPRRVYAGSSGNGLFRGLFR